MAGFCIVSNDNTRPTAEFIFPLGISFTGVWAVDLVADAPRVGATLVTVGAVVVVCAFVGAVALPEGVSWADVLEVVVVDTDGDETTVGSD